MSHTFLKLLRYRDLKFSTVKTGLEIPILFTFSIGIPSLCTCPVQIYFEVRGRSIAALHIEDNLGFAATPSLQKVLKEHPSVLSIDLSKDLKKTMFFFIILEYFRRTNVYK